MHSVAHPRRSGDGHPGVLPRLCRRGELLVRDRGRLRADVGALPLADADGGRDRRARPNTVGASVAQAEGALLPSIARTLAHRFRGSEMSPFRLRAPRNA